MTFSTSKIFRTISLSCARSLSKISQQGDTSLVSQEMWKRKRRVKKTKRLKMTIRPLSNSWKPIGHL
jgi:hypothetical protein